MSTFESFAKGMNAINLYPELNKVAGNLVGGLFLSILWDHQKCNPGQWLHKTYEEWAEDGFTRSNLDTARKTLKSKGILIEQKAGIPCRLFYHLDLPKLKKAIESV